MKKLLLTLFVRRRGAAGAAPAFASAREEARLIEASGVLEEFGAQRDTVIPDRLMQRAYGIAVIPNVVKVSAVVGGRRGSGAHGRARRQRPVLAIPSWSPSPAAASAGRSACSPRTRARVHHAQGIEGIADGKLTLGGDASVAAGPVGRSASAGTDQDFKAEVYSYSRNRGLFAGVSIDGSVIAIDSQVQHAAVRQDRARPRTSSRGASPPNADAAKRFERAIAASTAGSAQLAGASASTATASPDSAEPANAADDAGLRRHVVSARGFLAGRRTAEVTASCSSCYVSHRAACLIERASAFFRIT